MQFSDLGLAAELLRAVEEQGYTEPTAIQEQAIPPILAGKDVQAGAQTGTGKTAAFTLPLLQRLKPHANTSVSPARHPVRALILTPTRELAAQVFESVRTYGKHVPLKAACVFGGVSIDPQMTELRGGVEILVATPGRLLDHVHQRTVNLSQVQILVLDEADRMLDMGFMPDLKRIISLLPAVRQNLLTSATFPDDIKRFADQVLKDPVRIQVERRNTVTELVSHSAFKVDPLRKREFLEYLVRTRDMRQVLVFTSTRLMANRLTRNLERDGFNCAALHSDRTQQERMAALADFKEGKLQLLVATDIAARGLDIESLPHVINFELPPNPEDYIHRIGRTGRAGIAGEAISLVAPDELESLASIERLIKQKIPIQSAPAEALAGRSPRRGHGHGEEARTQRPQVEPAPAPVAAAVPHVASIPEGHCGALLSGGQLTTPPRAAPAPPADRRRKEVAALFLPPVTAKQGRPVPGTSEPVQTPEARFRQIIQRPDEDIDLAEAALLIAKTAYHDLDVPRYLTRIDELARALRARVPEDCGAGDLIIALNRFLFEEEGFAPNLEDYYDPRNSFLNEVLERRVGIPISLSVLYIEVGRRAGLPLQGVSFPGHFLVKCQLEEGMVILDPYCGGISLSLQDLQQRLREVQGGEVSRAIVAGRLVAANKKEILARMLRNLKAIYLEQQQFARALGVIDWIVALSPGEAAEVRDRGLTYLKLECFRAALEDLEHYLERVPAAEDLDEIRGCVVELRRSAARLN